MSDAQNISEPNPAGQQTNAPAGCAGGCPFSKLPASFWIQLLRPPFRKRHPLIFWLLILLAIFLLFAIIGMFVGRDEDESADTLALVEIRGPILNAEPALAWIRKLENKQNVKGVLLRIDSPGGGAAASQEVYAALKRLGAKMPIVVSMGATAASGGLMIAMSGERIYANASTVTGSIGVRMDIPQLQDLMQKIGVGQETLVTGPYKDAASYTHPLTRADRAYLMGVLENMHSQFVDIVAEARHMSRDEAALLANGKIYTGQEALKLGLVDELGGYDAALDWLAKKTGIPADQKLLEKPAQSGALLRQLLSSAENLGASLENASRSLSSPAFLYQF